MRAARLLSLSLLVAGLVSASLVQPAWAQAPASAEEAPSPSAGEQDLLADESPDWRQRYEQAHTLLRRGSFLPALEYFEALVLGAKSGSGRAQATVFANLARFWVEGRFVLTPAREAADTTTAEAAPSARVTPFVDRRTTDELAVLYTEGVFYGLGTGLTLATYTEPKSLAGGILPALALAGATEGLIAFLDRGPGLRYGAAQSLASGLFLGMEEGVVWIWWDSTRNNSSSWSAKTVASVLWATSTAGGVLGGLYGEAVGTTPGRMAFTGSAALWSSLFAGFTTAALTDRHGGNQERNALLASAVALNAGTIAGALLAKEVSPSLARARFLDLGGVAGGVLFGGLYLAVADREAGARGLFGSLSAGVATGVAAAWMMTRQLEPDDVRDPSHTSLALITPTISPIATGNGVMAGMGGRF